jgi:hypothetical protein
LEKKVKKENVLIWQSGKEIELGVRNGMITHQDIRLLEANELHPRVSEHSACHGIWVS